jgi:Flp pilus assembly protein TadG
MRTASTQRNRQRGSSIIEFAIGAFVMAFILLGTWEFGYSFYIYNNLLAAVDNGARYAAVRTYDSNSATPSAAFSTAVKNMVVFGQPTTGTKAMAPGLATTNVTLTPTFTNGVPTAMTVALSSYSLNAVVTSFNISKPQVTYPYMGVYSP